VSVVNEICADIEERLEAAGVHFALVIWMKGRPEDPKALCVASPPDARPEMVRALRAAPDVLGEP
jgi:hypothetical protein